MTKYDKFVILLKLLIPDKVVLLIMVIFVILGVTLYWLDLQKYSVVLGFYFMLANMTYHKWEYENIPRERKIELSTAMIIFTIGLASFMYKFNLTNKADLISSIGTIEEIGGAAVIFLLLSKSSEKLYEEFFSNTVKYFVSEKIKDYKTNVNKK